MTRNYNTDYKNSQTERKTPRERFQKVGLDRAENIIKSIQVFGKCHNTYSYEYSEQEISKIFKEIRTTLRETELLFTTNKKNSNGNVFNNLRDRFQ